LPTKVRPGLAWSRLKRRGVAGGSGNVRGCAGWRSSRYRAGHYRTGHGRGWSYAGRRGSRSGYRLGWSGGPGCLRLSRWLNGRPLGHSRSIIFSLLNCLQHVAGLGYARPIDLLLWLALYLRGAGAILSATVKVLAYPFCFIAFQRTGVCFLFGHTNVRQGVKDRPALHFQLAC
jgi:hypothetical protein